MADQYTHTSSQSWFSRIGGAFKGILVGIVFVFVAFLLLFWNEGRSVRRHKALEEGGGAVVSVAADQVAASNDGKLVHLTGRATTEETLRDPDFAVSENALRIRRTVEMYQWEESSHSETKKKLGGGTETVTTYSYDMGWAEGVVDSSRFEHPEGHENPAFPAYESWEGMAETVTVGAFRLPPSTVGRIDLWQELDAREAALPGIDGIERQGGGFYIGIDPAQPQLGDLRIRFDVVRPTEISLVARQVGSSFEPYRTSNGGTIDLLHVGTRSAEAMFQAAQAANKGLTWFLRALGFFLMFLGLRMIFSPLEVLADVVPLFGRIVGAGTGLISFLIAAVCSFLTIAVAWIVYRPLLGVLLLAVAGGLIYLLVGKMRKATPPPVPTMPPPPPPPAT